MTTTATRAPRLADWALSHGRSAFSTSDLAGILGVPPAQVSERLSAPLARHEWCTPARGLRVPVPPEYRAWGAPPGIEIVEALTQHLAVPYYVGWLSAAQQQGVAQQSPQLLQIAVSRQVRDRQVGRTRFAFRLRADVDQVPVRLAETRSGSVRVSSPEATALDIARTSGLRGDRQRRHRPRRDGRGGHPRPRRAGRPCSPLPGVGGPPARLGP